MLQKVLNLIAPIKKEILWAFILSVFIGFSALAPMAYMREVYGPIINSQSGLNIILISGLLIFVLFTAMLVGWIRNGILRAAGDKLYNTYIYDLFIKVTQEPVGSQVLRLKYLSDLDGIRKFIYGKAFEATLEAPVGLLFLVLIYIIHPVMGIFSTLGALLTLFVALLTEKRVRPLMRRANDEHGNSLNLFTKLYELRDLVQMRRVDSSKLDFWARATSSHVSLQCDASRIQGSGQAASKMIMLVQGSSMLTIGTLLMISGHIHPSDAILLIVAKLLGGLAIRPLTQLISQMKSFENVFASVERLVATGLLVVQTPSLVKLPDPAGPVFVNNITVTKPKTNQIIIQNINFSVKPGECIGIMGHIGAGKSTVLKACVGLVQCRSGVVLIDGENVLEWDREHLGRFIGYAPQSSDVFDTSLKNNIFRFEIESDEMRVEFDTIISDFGLEQFIVDEVKNGKSEGSQILQASKLSGGERQKIGLARAFFGNPKIIVLDEPEKNLHEADRATLMRYVETSKNKGSMIIMTTHNPSSLTVCDRLLVLERGSVKVYGPTQKVLDKLMGASRG